jgi:hypothetical protein
MEINQSGRHLGVPAKERKMKYVLKYQGKLSLSAVGDGNKPRAADRFGDGFIECEYTADEANELLAMYNKGDGVPAGYSPSAGLTPGSTGITFEWAFQEAA